MVSVIPRSFLVVVVVVVLGGCSPVPTYRWVDHATALATMSRQAKAIQTVMARCPLTLRKSDGTSLRLAGAMAMQRGGYLRIKGWQPERPTFDLTLTPYGLWIVSAPESPGSEKKATIKGIAEQLAHAWSLFTGDLFASESVLMEDSGSSRLSIRQIQEDQTTSLCEVDRKTLTARRYTLLDQEGNVEFTLELEHYRKFKKAVFPTQIIVTSKMGVFEASLEEVQINCALPAKTFIPPKGAEKLP